MDMTRSVRRITFQTFRFRTRVATSGPSRLVLSLYEIFVDLTLIQNFNDDKGFGFIVARKDGEEYDLPHQSHHFWIHG